MDKLTFQNLPELYLPICILLPVVGKEVIEATTVAEIMMVVYLENTMPYSTSPSINIC